MAGLQGTSRRLTQVSILVADCILLSSSFYLAHSLRFHTWKYHFLFSLTFTFICSITILCNYIFNLYETLHWRSRIFSPSRNFLSVLLMTLVVFTVIYFVAPTDRGGIIGRGVFISAFAGYFVSSLILRYFVEVLLIKREKGSRFLFIGTEPLYQTISQQFINDALKGHLFWLNLNHKESMQNLDVLLQESWTAIIVSDHLPSPVGQKLMSARLSGIHFLSITHFFEIMWAKIPIQGIDPSWFTFSDGFSLFHSNIQPRIKRLIDIAVALPMLILALPFMLLTAIAIRMESPGSVIYRQERVGQNGLPFVIFKFRSMTLNAEQNGVQWAQVNDARVTKVGYFIRHTRLDELPQLINILNGQMSFIGPRPERPEFTSELSKKIPFYDLRHLVKPGLTGWAQVNYPYGSSIEDAIEKLQYELYYIKNYSLALDLKIIAKTFSVVLFGKGR